MWSTGRAGLRFASDIVMIFMDELHLDLYELVVVLILAHP